MSEKMRESMSALMDGETTDFELRRLLESMDSPELRETWARYHLASAAMKRDAPAVLPHIDISAAVSQAIAGDDALSERGQRPMKAVAGFATAATIAFAAVIGVQGLDTGEERGMNSMAVSARPSTTLVTQAATPVGFSRYPVTGPSATLVGNTGIINPAINLQRTPQPGLQTVSLSSGHDQQPASAAHQQAARRQLETYLARHAELAGSWRPAHAGNASGTQEVHSGGNQWRARWLPSGYRLVAINNDVASDSTTPVLTSVYSNGLAAFSVFVSAAHDEPAMDLRHGATIACSRRIESSGNAYTATVVGEIPQLAAERIATSVYQIPQQ